MRCDDVMHELEGHGEGRHDRAVAEHLAVCRACARRAQRAADLERLWDATRTPEPTAETWERLWSSVATQVDRTGLAQDHRSWPGNVAVGDARARSERDRQAGRGGSRRALLALMILSQAAAILLGLSWYFDLRRRAPEPPAGPVVDLVIDLEEGQVPLVRWNGSKSEISDLSSLQSYNGEDPWLVFLNDVESATTAVAMKE